MTPIEIASIEAVAAASGQNRSEWLGQAALAYLGTTDIPATTDLVTLAEIMGIRSLILNLFAVVPGVAVETVRAIMSNADSIKRGDAERIRNGACQDGTPQ